MRRVLLIKTSSMGDIIHTLPALSDAGRAIPGITFDWVVEDVFLDIPRWHARVDQVIPVALRRWRKGIFSRATRTEWQHLRKQLHLHDYDLILDAQGLVKSAFLTYFAKGRRAGLDFQSAREWLASVAYHRKYKVNFYQHAIIRMRSLFSQALGYSIPEGGPDFGLDSRQFDQLSRILSTREPYLVFLHGTTWATKRWPELYWIQLAELAGRAGYRVKMSGGHPDEIESARHFAKHSVVIDVIPNLGIADMAILLAHAKGVVSVDTGLGHLSAALGVSTVSIYGSTDPGYTGALGKASIHLAAHFPCSPCLNRMCTYRGAASISPACYTTVGPERVWEAVCSLLSFAGGEEAIRQGG